LFLIFKNKNKLGKYNIIMEELNIVDLIENNPITKLNGNNYQSKMVIKI